MWRREWWRVAALCLMWTTAATGQVTERVVDVPTRPGVTQRLLVTAHATPKAAVVLIPGGHGGLQLRPDGSMQWGERNFLVRTRQLFAQHRLVAAVLDAPSDRQAAPFLGGFRQRTEHAADVK